VGRGACAAFGLPPAAAQPPLIAEALWGTVKTDDSLWEVETRAGQRTLVATLVKTSPGTWDFLLKSEARGGHCARGRARQPPRLARARTACAAARGWRAARGVHAAARAGGCLLPPSVG
jgi:hypothetical protein